MAEKSNEADFLHKFQEFLVAEHLNEVLIFGYYIQFLL
jgi:hypothetical protein